MKYFENVLVTYKYEANEIPNRSYMNKWYVHEAYDDNYTNNNTLHFV